MLKDIKLICGIHCQQEGRHCNNYCQGQAPEPPMVLAADRPPIMQYFEYAHLPPNLIPISQAVATLAEFMEFRLPDGPEKSAGLRKLLEAKDCFVRANLT